WAVQCKQFFGGQTVAIGASYFAELYNVIVLFEPVIVRFHESRGGVFQSGAKYFGRPALQFRRADPLTGLLNQSTPVAVEWHLQLNADHSIVVIIGFTLYVFTGLQDHRLDGLDHRRSFKVQIVRDRRSQTD